MHGAEPAHEGWDPLQRNRRRRAGRADRALPALVGHPRTRKRLYSWVPLGRVERVSRGRDAAGHVPQSATSMPTDGKTADAACWVRRIEGDQFQVFAVNCAHLGCPVRWFPQSGALHVPVPRRRLLSRRLARRRDRRSAACSSTATKCRRQADDPRRRDADDRGPSADTRRRGPPCA